MTRFGRGTLESISAQITLRPLRIGFLVDPDNRHDIGRVVRMATCMWGGMMCPLIPIMKQLPKPWRGEAFRRPSPTKITTGYLHFFEPDAFVETAPGQIDAAGLSRGQAWQDRNRFRHFDHLIAAEAGRAPYLDLGLSMHHAYEHLFLKEFQFRKRREARIFAFVDGDDVGRAFFEACYGLFPEDDRLDYVEKYYRGAFEPEMIEPTFAAWEAIERSSAEFPLSFTTRSLTQHFEGGWDESIYIFDPLSGPDVVDFWNARLFKRDIVPVNVHWLEQSRDLILELIRQNHRPLPSNPHGVMINTTVQIGRSLDAAEVMERLSLPQGGLPPHSAAVQPWYPAIWMPPVDDRMFHPVVAPLIAEKVEVQAVPSNTDDPTIRIPQLAPDFVQFVRGSGPSWVNVVHPRMYGREGQFAEAMPSAAVVECDGYPPLSSRYQIPTREGHITFQNYKHDSDWFGLWKRQATVFAWLKSQGIDGQPSDAGRVADQLIENMGGIDRTVLLAHREAVRQFDDMARSRSVRSDGNSEEFPERTATIGQLDSMIRKIQARLWGSHVILEAYVKAGVLRLGIAARCSHCTKENWYSLDDIADVIRCERCLKTFDFPQGRKPSKDAWKYRVVGPFATPHYAQGGYAVALTLRFLAHEIGSIPELTWTTGLELKLGPETLETDFFMWHGKHAFTRNARDPALLVGECKSFGTELFKTKDAARLRRLGELFPNAFLVAATMKDSFSARETKTLRALCRWGWRRRTGQRQPSRLIILTGHELFAIGPFLQRWKDVGGRLSEMSDKTQHIFSFEELARATQQAHLGFSEEEMHTMCYPRRRKGPPPDAKNMLVGI